MKPVRVLLVEDSRTQRKALSTLLDKADGIELIGEAVDGELAASLCKKLKPDVILMDVRMPRLDGLEATRRIMRESPTPILLMTSAGNMQDDVKMGLRAVECGALDLMAKPELEDLATHGAALVDRLKLLSGVPVISHVRGTRRHPGRRRTTGYYRRANRLVGIVASTGGPAALQTVLSGFPERLGAAVVVVQHLDGTFVQGLVRWLNEFCRLPVCIPDHEEELRQGVVYVCPTGRYAEVTETRKLALIEDDVPLGGHCPSGDRLLTSISRVYGSSAIGVVLTGMGADGAKGLLAVRDANGTTIAQDETTSVIYGMPKEATKNGAAQRVLPLQDIAATIAQELKE